MKSNSITKVALLVGIICSNLTLTSKVQAYERYTWSELVTGSNSIQTEIDSLNVITEWCGLKRIVKSEKSIFSVLKDSKRIISNKDKYSDFAYYKAVMDLRYLYLYAFKDLKKANECLDLLSVKSEFQSKKAAEILFSDFKSENILKDSFYDDLYNLKNKENIFPYDNGYMPEITYNHASFMLAIKEMLDGKGKQTEFSGIRCWNNIPADILYNIATDQRENAYKLYTAQKDKIDSKSRKLIEDFLYPLYMPVKKSDRKLLAGIFCIQTFPGLGMDLINESLSDSNRVTKPEHALACLSMSYMQHNAHNESQKVFHILSEYYPDSIWLK